MSKTTEQIFHPRGYMDDKHIKRCSISLVIREMWIKPWLDISTHLLRIGKNLKYWQYQG